VENGFSDAKKLYIMEECNVFHEMGSQSGLADWTHSAGTTCIQ